MCHAVRPQGVRKFVFKFVSGPHQVCKLVSQVLHGPFGGGDKRRNVVENEDISFRLPSTAHKHLQRSAANVIAAYGSKTASAGGMANRAHVCPAVSLAAAHEQRAMHVALKQPRPWLGAQLLQVRPNFGQCAERVDAVTVAGLAGLQDPGVAAGRGVAVLVKQLLYERAGPRLGLRPSLDDVEGGVRLRQVRHTPQVPAQLGLTHQATPRDGVVRQAVAAEHRVPNDVLHGVPLQRHGRQGRVARELPATACLEEVPHHVPGGLGSAPNHGKPRRLRGVVCHLLHGGGRWGALRLSKLYTMVLHRLHDMVHMESMDHAPRQIVFYSIGSYYKNFDLDSYYFLK